MKNSIFCCYGENVSPGDDAYTIPPENNGSGGKLTPASRDGHVASHVWETGDWLAGKAFNPSMLIACIRDKKLVYVGKFAPNPAGGLELTIDYRPEIIQFADGRRITMSDRYFWLLLIELAKKDSNI
ncbi:MAG TPA: hypothetical protein PKK43_14330 [Spirochaetota bacterium]|nr:hypothetical protein [Spirochaetota bacterium]